MKSNYNDIIDIILTLSQNDAVCENIAVSGSIVPYIIANKESKVYHDDFFIFVKQSKMDIVRKEVKNLTKQYELDIATDSLRDAGIDYGFKARYGDTAIGFFPYSLIDNTLTIKTYVFDEDAHEFKLKTRVLKDVSKSSVIRVTRFGEDKVRIMSPEFILAEREARGNEIENDVTALELLNNMCDDEALETLRRSFYDMKVKIETKKAKDGVSILSIVVVVLIVILLVVAYICFEK